MEKINTNEQNELMTTINAVMKNNYNKNQIQDFSLWIDNVLINEKKEVLN